MAVNQTHLHNCKGFIWNNYDDVDIKEGHI